MFAVGVDGVGRVLVLIASLQLVMGAVVLPSQTTRNPLSNSVNVKHSQAHMCSQTQSNKRTACQTQPVKHSCFLSWHDGVCPPLASGHSQLNPPPHAGVEPPSLSLSPTQQLGPLFRALDPPISDANNTAHEGILHAPPYINHHQLSLSQSIYLILDKPPLYTQMVRIQLQLQLRTPLLNLKIRGAGDAQANPEFELPSLSRWPQSQRCNLQLLANRTGLFV